MLPPSDTGKANQSLLQPEWAFAWARFGTSSLGALENMSLPSHMGPPQGGRRTTMGTEMQPWDPPLSPAKLPPEAAVAPTVADQLFQKSCRSFHKSKSNIPQRLPTALLEELSMSFLLRVGVHCGASAVPSCENGAPRERGRSEHSDPHRHRPEARTGGLLPTHCLSTTGRRGPRAELYCSSGGWLHAHLTGLRVPREGEDVISGP